MDGVDDEITSASGILVVFMTRDVKIIGSLIDVSGF